MLFHYFAVHTLNESIITALEGNLKKSQKKPQQKPQKNPKQTDVLKVS